MMISQPALICLEASWRRLLGRGDERQPFESPDPIVHRGAVSSVMPRIAVGAESEPSPAPAPRPDVPDEYVPVGPLTVAERRARAAALRALALSRGRRFASAEMAFTEAAGLDPRLDLTRTPTFWTLERAAHEAAIAAYVAVGRDRDAAVLRARVKSTFRPKVVRARPEPLPSS